MCVLELGAGCGVVGIGLAKYGAKCVLTDVAHVTPLLLHNCEQNHVEDNTTVVEYEWGAQMCAETKLGPLFDLIVAADVLYDSNISKHWQRRSSCTPTPKLSLGLPTKIGASAKNIFCQLRRGTA